MTRRRVLVVNDDGPAAAGLAALVRAVTADSRNDVVVAVPAADASSTGTALGAIWNQDVSVVSGSWPWARDRVSAAYEVGAYPAAIVTLAATGAFGPPPELVLAGINHGYNVGRGLIHSSTIGAALTAAAHHTPAVAFSAPADALAWDCRQQVVSRLLGALPGGFPADGALTVNLPPGPHPGRAGLAWCRVADADADAAVCRIGGPPEPHRVRISYRPPAQPPAGDTDVSALSRGQVALSWLALPYGRPPDPDWVADFVRRLSGAGDSIAVPAAAR